MQNTNRQKRRDLARKHVAESLKMRDKSMAKKQYGIGLILTNLMIAIIFWRWTWVLRDRRLK